MPSKQPNEIMATIYTAYLIKLIALGMGVMDGVVRCWGYRRDKNGKASPIDRLVKLIKIIHPYDPGGAREISVHIREVVDELDQAAGIASFQSSDGLLPCLKSLTKESNDVLMMLMGGEHDSETLRQAVLEVSQERAALERLDAAVREQLRKQEVSELQVIAETE